MYQLLKGVAHMHKHGVMHRDLKPQNLLVDSSGAHPLLKVADLGLGRHFTIPIKAYTHEVGGPLRGACGRGPNRPAVLTCTSLLPRNS
jgi:serine/threonine protein kinase